MVGEKELSVKEMTDGRGCSCHQRGVHLPIISQVPPVIPAKYPDKYPDKPRHPRQKYLLTPKGLMLPEQAAELVQGFGAVPVLCGLLPLTHGFETYIQDSIFSP